MQNTNCYNVTYYYHYYLHLHFLPQFFDLMIHLSRSDRLQILL